MDFSISYPSHTQSEKNTINHILLIIYHIDLISMIDCCLVKLKETKHDKENKIE